MNVIGKKQLLVSAFLGKYCLLIGISSCLLKFLPALISLTYFPSKGIYKPIQPILLWLLSKVQWYSLIFPHDLNVRNFEQLPQKKWWSKSNKVKEKKKKDKRKSQFSISLLWVEVDQKQTMTGIICRVSKNCFCQYSYVRVCYYKIWKKTRFQENKTEVLVRHLCMCLFCFPSVR